MARRWPSPFWAGRVTRWVLVATWMNGGMTEELREMHEEGTSGYALKTPASLLLGANIPVEVEAPTDHSMLDWVGVFHANDAECTSASWNRCWLQWASVPKLTPSANSSKASFQLYDPHIPGPGVFVLKYCTRTNPLIRCHATSNTFRIEAAPEGPRRPILLLPGLAGSVLIAQHRSRPAERFRLWVLLNEATAGASPATLFRKHLRCLNNNVSLHCDQTAPDYDVLPLPDRHGLDAVSVLDPDVLIGRTSLTENLYYFYDLITMLEANGWEAGQTLEAMPYDWRQRTTEPSTLERLHATLTRMRHSTGQRVGVIAHSMGGLVLSSYLAKFGAEGAANIDVAVTVATPFQGAGAKAYAGLLQGDTFGVPTITAEDVRVSAPSYGSAYHLLPSSTFHWAGNPPSVTYSVVADDGDDKQHVTEELGTVVGVEQAVLCSSESDMLKLLQDSLRGQTATFASPHHSGNWISLGRSSERVDEGDGMAVVRGNDGSGEHDGDAAVAAADVTEGSVGAAPREDEGLEQSEKNAVIDAMMNELAGWYGQTRTHELDAGLWQEAVEAREAWEGLQEAQKGWGWFSYYHVYGDGFDTPHTLSHSVSAVVGDESELLGSRHWHMVNEAGDGTVLAASGGAPHMQPEETLVAGSDHQAMVKDGVVMDFIVRRMLEEPDRRQASTASSLSWLSWIGHMLSWLVSAAGVVGVLALAFVGLKRYKHASRRSTLTELLITDPAEEQFLSDRSDSF